MHDLISAILYHHERWDGRDYPEHLAGNQIPLLARIVGIMDAYRAMCSDRPYRQAMDRDEALAELIKGAGTQFDPELVKMFVELVRSGEDFQLRQAGWAPPLKLLWEPSRGGAKAYCLI